MSEDKNGTAAAADEKAEAEITRSSSEEAAPRSLDPDTILDALVPDSIDWRPPNR